MSITPLTIACTALDTIRVEMPHQEKPVAVVPVAFLLAADRVMRYCLVADVELRVYHLTTDSNGTSEWAARIVNRTKLYARGSSPWEALKNLADKLEGA